MLRRNDGLAIRDGRLHGRWPEESAALWRGLASAASGSGSGRILIHRDHVIEDMVRLLGGHVAHIEAPFDPEPGAYASGHAHHRDHD